MKLSEMPLLAPAENLACDEALLDLCETGEADEILRFWEPDAYFVVVGYANRVAREVNVVFCKETGIPIFRRCSGGGTVLQGAGCLNYSLILRIDRAPALQGITSTNAYVLETQREVLTRVLGKPVQLQGHTDLAIEGMKFSGNAQRRRKCCLLFHGSILLNMDLDLITRALPMPSKQPEYRADRSHRQFLVNLQVPADLVKGALRRAWGASGEMPVPAGAIRQLVAEKYSTVAWNQKF